ncbi:MFS transporter [Streptomyces sp. NPDC046821]|uniref:MFS transporter n=1 Tax=Streptomyces sp. NPDC046821 TaxID=3154702 RepID=UPI0033F455FB
MPRSASPGSLSPSTASTASVVGFLVFIELCSGILQGAVPVVVPLIGNDLHVSAGDLNWVNSVFLLVAGISVPLLSRLGDIYGHRRMIRITMLIVVVGSVIVATANSFGVLLIGRALQGVFACWLPLDFAIVRDRVQKERVGAAIGMLVGALTLGATLGTLGMGVLSREVHNVHGLLLLPVGAILLCLPVAFRLIPESVTRAVCRIDWAGAALLSSGLAAVMFGMAMAKNAGLGTTAGALALGAVLLALFVRTELRAPQPLVDVRLMARPSMALLYGLSFLTGAVLYGAQTANPSFFATPRSLGFGFGMSAFGISLLAAVPLVAMAGAGAGADRVVRRFGPQRTLIGGFTLVAAAYLGMVFAHHAPWQLAVLGGVSGIGIGTAIATLPTLLMRHLPADQTGIGTGMYNTLKTLAGSMAGAAFAAAMNRLVVDAHGTHVASESAYVTVWASCGALALLGVVVARRVGRTRSRAEGRPAAEAALVAAVAAD